MNRSAQFQKSVLATAIAIGALCASTWQAEAGPYVQTNLVSDGFLPAELTDPTLINPWGVARSATSPFWTSNQGTSTTSLFNVSVTPPVKNPTVAPNIPPGGAGPVGPTGQVNNNNPSTSSFPVIGGDTNTAHFIFANLNGTISAWDTGGTAFIQVTTTGATYTGLAISHDGTQLYAANDAGSGSIDVFNPSWSRVTTTGFATPSAISSRGLVPFNVQDINGQVYVTYAPAGRTAQQSATPGQGAVAIFNEAGVLQSIVINSPTSALAAPWGIALAPSNWGPFSGDLLVGNLDRKSVV